MKIITFKSSDGIDRFLKTNMPDEDIRSLAEFILSSLDAIVLDNEFDCAILESVDGTRVGFCGYSPIFRRGFLIQVSGCTVQWAKDKVAAMQFFDQVLLQTTPPTPPEFWATVMATIMNTEFHCRVHPVLDFETTTLENNEQVGVSRHHN